MQLQKGFTLIELMIVVVIVAILAAVSIPAYSDYVRRGKIAEAASALSGLRVSMEQYYQDNRSYIDGAGACGVAMPNNTVVKYFDVTCGGALPHPSVATATTYIIAATGRDSMAGFTYTINQSNAKATTAVPTGWLASATCWVTNKGGAC